jgi:hypothetical protein
MSRRSWFGMRRSAEIFAASALHDELTEGLAAPTIAEEAREFRDNLEKGLSIGDRQ